MMRFYSLIKLEKDASLIINKNNLFIDLDQADLINTINDDEAFRGSISPQNFFWVSGGGTYLVNKRYLFLVKRSGSARVNPNKYSLFTGRADSLDEQLEPELLVRELFEELILFSSGKVCYPSNKRYQKIIDSVYQDLESKFELAKYPKKQINLTLPDEPNQQVRITHRGGKQSFNLNYYINKNNDINILFLFSVELDIAKLTALDGEYHLNKNEVLKHNRDIYLYDTVTSSARNITAGKPRESVLIGENEMTEHLLHMLDGLVKS